ncbi:hypothetical protein QCE62_35025, partial [Caballeronia sp. LZ033]|uniref:bacteriophage T4 gp5 trimerisation domain-containing protein n=1 Tax=Caballeronia sp. LZ033 TaxID=3038566 RepID=UPI0028670AC5|nr:hypothetical protein [Caballeronia sp. LZ033]
ANMFRFEDKQGSEQIKLHAERNYDTSVEANTTHTTAGSHTIEVGLPLASGDSSTSPPPSGAQRLLNQQASTSTGATGQLQAMAARKGKRGKKAQARSGMQQSTPVTSTSTSTSSSTSTPTPTSSSITLASQVPTFLQNFSTPKLGGSALNITVNGMEKTLVVGSTQKVYLGEELKITDGTSTVLITGIETKDVDGSTTTTITGLATSFVLGNRADTTIGNALQVHAGQFEGFQVAALNTWGSNVIAVGSQVHNTGNWVQSTGSMIVDIGSSVNNMGVKMGHVGYDVKF